MACVHVEAVVTANTELGNSRPVNTYNLKSINIMGNTRPI